MSQTNRKSWDQYFMEIVEQVSTRSTCDRKHVGAIAVNNKRILATGYNGAPENVPHCSEHGHDLITVNGVQSCSRAIHAEANVVGQCAKYGIALEGAIVYVNTYPCYSCFKLLVSSGVKKVIAEPSYKYVGDPLTEQLSKDSGVTIVVYQKS